MKENHICGSPDAMSDANRTKDAMALPASLREWADSNLRGRYGPGLLRIAADHIESLTAERDADIDRMESATEMIEKLNKEANGFALLNDTQRDKIRELEAERDSLRTSLDQHYEHNGTVSKHQFEKVCTERDHYKPFPDLLKRATFLLGTLCLAHGVTSENVQRLLDDAGNALKGVQS